MLDRFLSLSSAAKNDEAATSASQSDRAEDIDEGAEGPDVVVPASSESDGEVARPRGGGTSGIVSPT